MTRRTFCKATRALVASFRCEAGANGKILVEPSFTQEPLEPGAPVLGLLDRKALAAQAEEILNGALGKSTPTREEK